MTGKLLGLRKYIQTHTIKIILIGIFSIGFMVWLADPVTRWLSNGKSFAGRSFFIQAAIATGLFTLIFSVIFIAYALLLNWLGQNQRGARIQKWVEAALDFLSTQSLLKQVSLGIVLAGLLLLLILNLRIVFFPYQMEFREGAIVLTNQAFLNGINPWALENNLEFINVYGVVYNALILPFTWLLGNHIWIYRFVSLLAILGQIFLLGKVLLRNGAPWLYTGMAAIFLWLGQIYYTTPMARPDTLGQLFFLLTIFIPVLGNFSIKTLFWSGLFAILGFYTKTYFVLGLPLLAVYLFLFVSKVRAITYAAGVGAMLVGTALLINHFFEAYFLNVVFSHIADTNQIFSYMIEQTIRFVRDYWSILFFTAVALVQAIRSLFRNPIPFPKFDFDIKKPLFTSRMSIHLFCLLVSAGLIYFSLGRHNGTKMAYYYQLLSPFLLLLVVGYLQKTPRLTGLATLLITINLLTHGWENLKPDLQPYPVEEWKKVQLLLEGKQQVVNSPAITYELMKAGIPVVNSGQTSYYYPYPESNFLLYPDRNRIQTIGDAFLQKIQTDLAAKQFDLALVDYPYPAFAKGSVYRTTYLPGEIITISMPHTMQTWQVQVMTPRLDE